MRGGRVFFILAFVLILGLIGLFVVWRFFLSGSSQPTTEAPPTPIPVEVLVVTQNISAGTKLDETTLTAAPWPQDSFLPGMFRSDQLIELKGRVVKYDVSAGLPILDGMLLKDTEQIPTEGSPWAFSIPPGQVAISLPMSRIGFVAYGLRPGDHVDVIGSQSMIDVDTDFQTTSPNFTGIALSAGPPDPETKEPNPLTVGVSSLGPSSGADPVTGQLQSPPILSPGISGKVVINPQLGQAVFEVPSELQRPRIVSYMLLQNVVVLQVGNFPTSAAAPVEGDDQAVVRTVEPGMEGGPTGSLPDVITLIVRPQDAVTLNYLMLAQSQMAAHLSLVLRGANDNSRETVLPVTLQFLLEQYQIPVPARLPYSLSPRLDKLVPPAEAVATPIP